MSPCHLVRKDETGSSPVQTAKFAKSDSEMSRFFYTLKIIFSTH